jgi:hypothetical protein
MQTQEIDNEVVGGAIQAVEAIKLEDLLSAFYLRRREISSFKQLNDLVDMADFWCALPTVSMFVEANLHNSPGLLVEIPNIAPELMVTATKLRSRTLFREAFIHIVGRWSEMESDWNASELIDPPGENGCRELRCLAEFYHGRLCSQLVDVNSFLLNCCVKEPRVSVGKQQQKDWQAENDLEDLKSEIIRGELQFHQGVFGKSRFSTYERLYFASFMPNPEQTERYGVLRCKAKYGTPHLARELQAEVVGLVREKLGPVMRNYLQLDTSVFPKADFDYFLCTDLEERDLPWDADEREW